MKIDRSQEAAVEVVKSNAKDRTNDPAVQNLSENLLKIGFENQFQKNETSRIKNLIDDLIDEYLINKD